MIDDDCADYDIHLVMIDDAAAAKKYGVKSIPGLVFFRNGKPIKYEGDLTEEEAVLEWLTNKDNLEISDRIEKVNLNNDFGLSINLFLFLQVNRRMFEKMLSKSQFLAVLFYQHSECRVCEKILNELENVSLIYCKH